MKKFFLFITLAALLGSCAKEPETTPPVVTPKPAQPGAISGPENICQGTDNMYSISAVAGATSYTWTLPAGWSGSSTTTSIQVTAGTSGGNISVTANNSAGASPVKTLSVAVANLPMPAGSISGATEVFQDTNNVVYSVGSIPNATNYVWAYSGTGATIKGTGNSITLDFAADATSGNLIVFGSNSCGNGGSFAIPIVVSERIPPPPPIPTLADSLQGGWPLQDLLFKPTNSIEFTSIIANCELDNTWEFNEGGVFHLHDGTNLCGGTIEVEISYWSILNNDLIDIGGTTYTRVKLTDSELTLTCPTAGGTYKCVYSR